jgi:hypothetical protein
MSVRNPIIIDDDSDEDIETIIPGNTITIVRPDTPAPRITHPFGDSHESSGAEPFAIVPPGAPHSPDSDSEKENVPPSQEISGELEEGEVPDHTRSEPAPESNRIEEETPNASDPDRRSMGSIKRRRKDL